MLWLLRVKIKNQMTTKITQESLNWKIFWKQRLV